MILLDVVANLGSFDAEQTIFAFEPWSPTASAVVAPAPAYGNISQGLSGHAYFLEISIAREFLEDWTSHSGAVQSLEEKCERLISYATNDA